MDIKLAVEYLTILELPFNERLTIAVVKENYQRLSHLYHPDTASEVYKDGQKFIELKNAYDFVTDNIVKINKAIRDGSINEAVDRSQTQKKKKAHSSLTVVNPYSNKKRILHIIAQLAIATALVSIFFLPTIISVATHCDHSYSPIQDNATCVVSGERTYKCKKCGRICTGFSPALGHTWGPDNKCIRCGISKTY